MTETAMDKEELRRHNIALQEEAQRQARETKQLKKDENFRKHETIRTEAQRKKMELTAQKKERKLQGDRECAKRDARSIEVNLDHAAMTESVSQLFQSVGEIEKCSFDQFNGSFSITFKDLSAAEKAVAGGVQKLDGIQVTPVAKLNRLHCIYFGDPKVTLPTDVKSSETEHEDLLTKIQDLMRTYGPVTRFSQSKDCFIFEYENFDDAQNVLTSATDHPESFVVNNHAITPMFSGVPKRNYAAIKRRRDAVEQNLESAKLNKLRKKQNGTATPDEQQLQARETAFPAEEASTEAGGGPVGGRPPPGGGYYGPHGGYGIPPVYGPPPGAYGAPYHYGYYPPQQH